MVRKCSNIKHVVQNLSSSRTIILVCIVLLVRAKFDLTNKYTKNCTTLHVTYKIVVHNKISKSCLTVTARRDKSSVNAPLGRQLLSAIYTSGTVADPAMGGQGAPPHWPKLRAGHGGATQTRRQIFT